MIQHAPGYNLSRHRQPARAATGRGTMVSFPTTSRKLSEEALPCLRDLCEPIGPIAIQGKFPRPIVDVCVDSRRASAGALFFALPGEQTDGSYFIQEAIDRGAVAIVTEKAGQHHPLATFIQVRDAREALAIVSRRFFKFSAGQPAVTGITGSHGKTCVAHLLQHLLRIRDEPVGLFSSIHYDLGSRVVPSYRTTPESLDLYGMLAQAREIGCRRAVLEIGARGIQQKRVSGLPLDVAIFLNLGREHADCHGGEEKYFLAKSSLFTGEMGPLPRVAAVNLDDSWGRRLIEMIPESVRVVTFGRSRHAVIRATEVEENRAGASLRIVWPEGSAKVRTRQIGSFAVGNLLAAVAGAYAAGLDLNLVLPRLFSFGGAPGRMEEVNSGQPFRLIVDYARTPEAARYALRAAREVGEGRLLVVFGCSGERDSAKRPLLVNAVQEEADFCWATADHPRNEPLGNIFSEMETGATDPEKMVFIDDRRRAIALALDTAQPGDVVVLLGKGHEVFQHVGDAALPFDDRLVARELMALREVALTGS